MQRKSYIGIDLTGERKGRFEVLRKADFGRTTWVCKCDCGKEFYLTSSKILNDGQISCGCAEKENNASFGEKTRTHGGSYTPLYKTWRSMLDRCYNSNIKNYQYYGARGIKVCDEWRSDFAAFRDWAISTGYKEGADRTLQSIDRIDVNGDYCPENCWWATARTQQKNKRDTTLYSFRGEEITLSEFADKYGISDKSIVYRKSKRGAPLDVILNEWHLQHNLPDRLMEVSEYAEKAHICSASVRRQINEGKIQGEKIGRKWYVVRKEFYTNNG